jgi:hypothetical protein
MKRPAWRALERSANADAAVTDAERAVLDEAARVMAAAVD